MGQTSLHTVQSKLQNPFSKLTVGCITPPRPYSMKAGFSTCDGHLLTQRWHDVQCCWKRFWLTDPGGVIGFSFLYAFLPSIVAMDSCAFVRSVGAAPAVASPASRKRRLEESAATEDDSVATGCFSIAEERCCPFEAGA